MLYEFLQEHRSDILTRARDRIREDVGQLVTDAELDEGVPVFFDQLVHVLRRQDGVPTDTAPSVGEQRAEMDKAAARHGETLLRVGFTISQVVRGYGALCQTITGLLDELRVPVSAREYETLNRCLDDAIAEAVTSFEALSDRGLAAREVEHLGALAHELRNALTAAMSSLHLLKLNLVGFSGRTPMTLEHALTRMRVLIDRSLTEVRLRADFRPVLEPIRLADVFDYVSTTAGEEAARRGLTMTWLVDPTLIIDADRQLLISAVTNLVQNAVKYSRRGGTITARAIQSGDAVVVEVEDACGGLPDESLDRLFDPYVQVGRDRSGLGLGLSIVQRSVQAHNGVVSVRNQPGKGCVFIIELPRSARGREIASIPSQAARERHSS